MMKRLSHSAARLVISALWIASAALWLVLLLICGAFFVATGAAFRN